MENSLEFFDSRVAPTPKGDENNDIQELQPSVRSFDSQPKSEIMPITSLSSKHPLPLYPSRRPLESHIPLLSFQRKRGEMTSRSSYVDPASESGPPPFLPTREAHLSEIDKPNPASIREEEGGTRERKEGVSSPDNSTFEREYEQHTPSTTIEADERKEPEAPPPESPKTKCTNKETTESAVHPCLREYGSCRYGEKCVLKDLPADSCVPHIYGSCHFGNSCHWRHAIGWEDIKELVNGKKSDTCATLSADGSQVYAVKNAGVGGKVQVAVKVIEKRETEPKTFQTTSSASLSLASHDPGEGSVVETSGGKPFTVPTPYLDVVRAAVGREEKPHPEAMGHPVSRLLPSTKDEHGAGTNATGIAFASSIVVRQPAASTKTFPVSSTSKDRGAAGSSSDATTAMTAKKIEALHPCLARFGHCKYGENCEYANEPADVCIFFLQGKCKVIAGDCPNRHERANGNGVKKTLPSTSQQSSSSSSSPFPFPGTLHTPSEVSFLSERRRENDEEKPNPQTFTSSRGRVVCRTENKKREEEEGWNTSPPPYPFVDGRNGWEEQRNGGAGVADATPFPPARHQELPSYPSHHSDQSAHLMLNPSYVVSDFSSTFVPKVLERSKVGTAASSQYLLSGEKVTLNCPGGSTLSIGTENAAEEGRESARTHLETTFLDPTPDASPESDPWAAGDAASCGTVPHRQVSGTQCVTADIASARSQLTVSNLLQLSWLKEAFPTISEYRIVHVLLGSSSEAQCVKVLRFMEKEWAVESSSSEGNC